MAEQFPIELAATLNDFRIVITDRNIERNTASHAMARHDIRHAPETDAIAVIAPGIAKHIGLRAGPGHAARIGRWIKFIMLNIGRDPKGDASAIGPANLGAPPPRHIVIMARFAQHAPYSFAHSRRAGISIMSTIMPCSCCNFSRNSGKRMMKS